MRDSCSYFAAVSARGALGALAARSGSSNVASDRMVSMLAHESVEAAKKSDASFKADPAWIKVKLDSEKKIGTSLTTRDGIRAVLVKPTDESPLK